MRTKYLTSVVILAINVAFPLQVYAAHDLCQKAIEGVTLNSTPVEAGNALDNQGLADITCNLRSKLSCEDRKKQGVTFSTDKTGQLKKLGDKTVNVFFNRDDGHVYNIIAARRINAPNTLQAYDENRNWDEWSEADLIRSKIKKYCSENSPEGVQIRCNYRSGVDITVLVGSPRDWECKYNFEARFSPARGSTAAGHVIRESLSQH